MSTLSTKIVTLAPVPAIINLVSNPNTATGWLAANGGATLATTQAAGDLPLGTAITTAIKVTSGTSTRAEGTLAETTSYAFITPAAYAVKTGVEFWLRPGTNFLNNEWTVSIYAGATRQSLTTDASAVTYIPNALGKFTTYFDAVASTAYTLRFTRTVNAGTNAGVLNVTNVIVGPGIQPQGAVVGPWVSYTPTVTGLGAGSSTNEGFYRQSGESLEIKIRILKDATPGSGASEVSISLPTGFTANALALPSNNQVGWGNFSGSTYTGAAQAICISNLLTLHLTGSNTNALGSTMTANSELDFAGLMIPVNELAGSGTVNLAQNDVAYYYPTGGTWGTGGAVTCSIGPGGVLLGSTAVAGILFAWTMTPPTPVPIGTRPRIDISGDGIHWFPLSGVDIENLRDDGTNFIGAGVALLNNGDISLQFGKYPSGVSSAWTQPAPAYLRVVIELPGQAVGFGGYQAASSTNPAGISGLVPAAGLPGRTDGVAVAAGYVGERINSTSLSQTATVTANTAVDVSGSALPLTPGVWLVYFMGLFRIRNLSGGSLSVDGAIQLVTNAGVFAGGLFEVAGLQTLTGADTSFTASFAVPIVVAANTTYKLQVINSASSATSIAYFSAGGTFTNDASPLFYGLRIG